jgi:cytochrome c oxidase subunit 2
MFYQAFSGLGNNNVHGIIFFICCMINIIIFGILLYTLIKFHTSHTNIGFFHKTIFQDLGWTLLPFVILIALVLPIAIDIFHRMLEVSPLG